MLNINCILCPTDFSEYSVRAYDYARSLARHYGAKLCVEHAIQELGAAYPYYDFPEMAAANLYESLNRSADSELQEMIRKRPADGVETETAIVKGAACESILNFAKDRQVDLIVMGTHGRRGLDHLMMGSVTERVIRRAPCPVLAVRRPTHDFVDPQRADEPVALHKVLYCSDFSPPALSALRYALSLAEEYEAELTLLHVIDHRHEGLGPGAIPEATLEDLQRELAAEVPPDASNWCSVNPLVSRGRPYEKIIQIALEQQSDLVVMGVRGRDSSNFALFGSTTRRVIRLGPCPVLVVQA